MNEIGKIIGERIKQLRKNNDWSQEELAHRANLNRTFVGAIERGEKNITIESLSKIASALEISLEEIFKYIQPVSKNTLNTSVPFIINRINAMNENQQKAVLEFLDLLTKWKDY